MVDATSEQLTKSIRAILKDGDLDNLSAKKIRKMLEAEYKVDYTERKEEIDKLVMKLITEDQEEEEESEKEPPAKTSKSNKVTNGKAQPTKRPAPASSKNGSQKSKAESEASNSDIVEEEDDDSDITEIEDREVVPKKKAKVQSPSKKVNDELLAKQLQDEDSRPSRRCKAQAATKKPRKQKSEKPKGTSVYSRPCELLPPLSTVMETDKMPRPMIVKRMWEIVKEKDLLDPKNKQFMLCDDEMLELFGKKKVRMFGMMKLLKPYIKDLPKE